MGKSALFFDIDGTILSEITKEIPRSAMESLQKAKKKGHLLFINTGRTYCSIPAEIKSFPFDGYLCGCGSYLTYHDEILFEKHLRMERAQEIWQYAMDCGIDGIYEGTEDVFFTARVSRFDSLENTRRYMNNRGLGVERYLEQGKCEFDKMFVYTDAHSRKEDFFRFIESDMDIVDRGQQTYECILKGYSKATAVQMILDKFRMTKEDSYVFGDSSNDLTMLQYSPHSVVMGAHDPVLDPYAEFVTKTVEDDGIAYALEHYSLV